MPRQTINYAMAATLLSQGLNYEQAAQQVGAKNGNSLKVGLFRRGVSQTATRSGEFAVKRATIVAKAVVNEASKALKEEMSGLLATHTSALKQIKPRANLKHIMRVGMALEPLVRSAKTIHGWGDEAAQGLIIDVRQADPDSANVVTDVATTVTPMVAEGTIEQNCGMADTSSSGVVEQAELQKPQEQNPQ